MLYFYLKALHIIFVVSWFAGLFYIVRLFIYHTEAFSRDEVARDILHHEYIKNERLLWRVITTPAMILTLVTGLGMIHENPVLLQMDWMIVKLFLVGGLIAYHFYCGVIMRKLWNAQTSWSSFQLRLWNEVATLFLVAIVFIVILKNAINWVWGTVGFFIFAILIMTIVKVVKSIRTKK